MAATMKFSTCAGANIDFQFLLDEYSTVMYICSYMMKSEKAMGEVLQSVAR